MVREISMTTHTHSDLLQGIFPVVPTLFCDDDTLNIAEQRRVIRWALDAGAHGLVFPGVASEYNFLTPTERGKLLEVVSNEVNGQVPIIGGASAQTAAEVITAGQQALQVGVNRLMIMAPKKLGTDVSEHKAFFLSIAKSLPSAEIILQNAPTPIGAGLNADSIALIASHVPSIKYIKEETLPSGPAISFLLKANIPNLLGVFGGGGSRYVIDEFNRGALAALPAIELTDLHVAIYEAHTGGNHPKARELYRLSLPLLVAQAVYRMRFTKYVLKKRNIANAEHVRALLPKFDEQSKLDIDQMLGDLQASFKS